jgi:hypothetical protein
MQTTIALPSFASVRCSKCEIGGDECDALGIAPQRGIFHQRFIELGHDVLKSGLHVFKKARTLPADRGYPSRHWAPGFSGPFVFHGGTVWLM